MKLIKRLKNLWRLSEYEIFKDGETMIKNQTTLLIKRPQIIKKKSQDPAEEITNGN